MSTSIRRNPLDIGVRTGSPVIEAPNDVPGRNPLDIGVRTGSTPATKSKTERLS